MDNVAFGSTNSDILAASRHCAAALRNGRFSLHLQAALEPAARWVQHRAALGLCAARGGSMLGCTRLDMAR